MSENDNDIEDLIPRSSNPLKGESKTSRIPIKVIPAKTPLAKPAWIRAKAPTGP